MAVEWSTWLSVGAGVSVRVGLDMSWSAGTMSWAFTGQVSGGSAFGTDSWSTSGAVSTGGTRSWSSSGTFAIASGTKAVPQTGSAQTVSMTATLSNIAGTSSSRSVSNSVTVPANATIPAAPTGLTVTRVSDTRQNLAWTPSAGATEQHVQRRIGSGSYSTIAVISGSATSYADTSTVANRWYRYAVRAVNSAGMSAWSDALVRSIYTTPATPAAPSASKTGAGDVTVTRPAMSDAVGTWDVRHAQTGTVLASDLPVAQTTWSHSAPSPATAWAYQVRASSPAPVLTSGWSPSSNTIAAAAPPLAPTNLTPAVADATQAITLGWKHNPADGSPQSAHEVQTRASDVDPWVTYGAVIPGPASSRTVFAGTWSNPGTRQWRVRTWGQHADPGAWSATGLLALSARPVATITTPATTSWSSSRMTVEWSYHDAEGSAQAGWRLELLLGSDVVEIRSGMDSSTSATLATHLQDGSPYLIRLTVMDGAGLWSDVAQAAVAVFYTPPATPELVVQWLPDEGYTVLRPTVPAPTGGQSPLDHVRVERASDGGWVTVADDITSGATVTDMIPPTGTVVHYRAVAVSDTGTEAYATVPVDTTTRWVFLNHGAGFGQVVRVWGNLRPSRSYRRAKTLKHYAGRPLPVERAGTARTRTYDLTAALFAPWHADQTSTWDDVEALEDAAAPVCVRDPEGTRLFVSVGGVDMGDAAAHLRDVSIPMTVVDYSEDVAV